MSYKHSAAAHIQSRRSQRGAPAPSPPATISSDYVHSTAPRCSFDSFIKMESADPLLPNAVPSLPQELVRHVCLVVDSATSLFTILSVCIEWRAAVDDEAWRRVTLFRFPHVPRLIEVLKIDHPPCYRKLYRDQMLALRLVTPQQPCPKPSVNERLQQFAFTVELVWSGAEDKPEMLSWVGHLQASPVAETVIDCVGCQLWDGEGRAASSGTEPTWVAPLLDAWDEEPSDMTEYAAQRERICQGLRLSMRVSKVVPGGTRTLCIAEALSPDSNTFEAGSFGFGFVGEFFDALPTLPCAPLECMRVFSGQDALGSYPPNGPRIRPYLDVRVGLLDGIFCTHADASSEGVMPEAVVEYLERFAPW